MFCAMDSQFLQPNGQVVDADASIAINIQDLEKNLEPVLLVSTSADGTRLGQLWGGWGRALGLPCSPAEVRLCRWTLAEGAVPVHRCAGGHSRNQ